MLKMRIAVDAFGGDNAPLDVLKGSAEAIKLYDDISVILTGKREIIEATAKEHNISMERIKIVDAPSVIEVEESPIKILKEKSDCSMAVAFKLLAEGEADAFLSAGSTAAIVVGASSYIKKIKGVKRAALSTVMPSDTGFFLLLDAGANIDCKPEVLTQFGIMGSIYMEKVMGVNNPRVALANIGEEDCKGDTLRVDTYQMLKDASINFTGNIEARDIPLDGADVVVADGFTGNVILKLMEGMGKVLSNSLKRIFFKNAISKISALLVKGSIKDLRKKMDYTEYGGAPLLGIAKPVIKAHGSSNAKAFRNAIRQARFFVQSTAIKDIEENIKSFSAKKED